MDTSATVTQSASIDMPASLNADDIGSPGPAGVSDNRMVQQRLGRVVLADGTAVSYASVGAGRPLVYVMGWLTHLQLSLVTPRFDAAGSVALAERMIRQG